MPRILKNWEQNIIWPMVWSSRTNLRSAYCCSQQRAPSLLPECCLWHFTGMIIPHTCLLCWWIGETESIGHQYISENYYDIEEMRTHDTQLSPNIPLPSWKFLHLVIILECITSVLWMQIFGTILTTTAHNLVLKTKRLKAYGITFACFVITIKHDLILESFLYKYF